MVTLHRQASWKIAVYGREHGPPHFHVEGPGWRCSVLIGSLELMVGGGPARELRAAKAWAEANRPLLTATWRKLNL